MIALLALLLALSPHTATAACPGTPASIANLACCEKFGGAAGRCYDRGIETIGASADTKTLLDMLEKATDIRDDRCHPIAHAIGRHSFRAHTTFADAFHACDERCHYGCYHGVVEAAFGRDKAPDQHITFEDMKESIPTLCAEIEGRGVRYQCSHGLGHAILYTLGYQVTKALEGCDLIENRDDRTSCHLGVFMENALAADRELRDLRADDPLYPCSALPPAYKHTCFLDHTRVLFGFGLAPAQVAEQCMKAEGYERACFRSFGRDRSNAAREGRAAATILECESLAGAYAKDCIEGAAAALADFTGTAELAFPFCAALAAENSRLLCFRSVAEYLRGIYARGKDELTTECDAFVGGAPNACHDALAAHAGDPLGIVIEWISAFLRWLFGSH